MRRNARYDGDEALRYDLDTGFMGWNDRLDPSLLRTGNTFYDLNKELLQPGLVAESVNLRFLSGKASTRPGCWTPVHWNPGFVGIAGAAVYSDIDGTELLCVAARDAAWLLRDGMTPRSVDWPAGQVLTDRAEVVQAFQSVIVFRGADAVPWIWDGDPRRAFAEITAPVQDPERPDFLSPLPNAEWGIMAGDRLWVPISRDTLAWSDILDANAFDLTLNTVRLNAGDGDALVAAIPFETSIIAWKSGSIYRISGIVGDPAQTITVERLTAHLGCVSRRSIAQVGSDVLWLAAGGVYRLSQSYDARLQSSPVPVSEAIETTMQRINWTRAHLACAVVADRYYYLAVPLDSSPVPNAILVYDTVLQMWQGIDRLGGPAAEQDAAATGEWAPVAMYDPWHGAAFAPVVTERGPLTHAAQLLLRTDLWGRQVAVLVDTSRIIALGVNRGADHIDGVDYPIETRLTTRGYVLGELGIKKLRNLTAGLHTWDAELRLSVVTDGAGESRVLTDWTARDRTAYTVHGRGQWDPENLSQTFSAAHRQDYAIVAGDGTTLEPAGLPISLDQSWLRSMPLRVESRWLALRVETRRGHISLHSVSADGLGERHAAGTRNA